MTVWKWQWPWPCSNLEGSYKLPQNYKLHMHTLDFEASFTELSLLEGRNLMPQTISAKRERFFSPGWNSRGTVGWSYSWSYTTRGFPLPPFPRGNISIDVQENWVSRYDLVEKECFSLIWNRRDTLLAFAGKANNTPLIGILHPRFWSHGVR